MVRKAFKQAQAEKPGVSFIDFPENIAEMEIDGKSPVPVQHSKRPLPPIEKIRQAAEILSAATYPLILAGNGVIRAGATEHLIRFAEQLNIPVVNTFMAKGVMPFSHPLWLGAVGLQARDVVACGFDRADVIVCVGYDMVEYHPNRWHPDKSRQIIHIDGAPAEVDEHYVPDVEVVGDIGAALDAHGPACQAAASSFRPAFGRPSWTSCRPMPTTPAFPLKPQRHRLGLAAGICLRRNGHLRRGAHKIWMARMYQPERPNTCIISNGFASMGIALARGHCRPLAFPSTPVVAVTGDAGFLMNSQEIETAMRIGTPMVIVIWNDGGYGLIEWHQLRRFGRTSNVAFSNPDFVKYAESFGAKGYRVGAADELLPILQAGDCREYGRGDRLPGGLFGEHETDRAAEQVGVPGVEDER